MALKMEGFPNSNGRWGAFSVLGTIISSIYIIEEEEEEDIDG